MRVKYLLIFIAVLSVVCMLADPGYARINPENIVGIWLFDEGEGDIAEDSSGNGNHLRLMNGTAWGEGKFGKALSFDGVDDFATATVPNAPQGADLRTVVGWAKSNNPGIKSGVVAYGNPAINCVFGFLHYNGVWVSQLWGPSPWDLETKAKVDTSWHHHAVLYDGKSLIHYFDGEEVANAPRNPTTVGTTLIIGAEVDVNDWYNGFIDEVGFFNVALTVDDIKSIMTEGLKLDTAVSSAGKLITTWAIIKRQLW